MEQEKKGDSDQKILLTGVTGYLAGHILYYLLQKGIRVRGTVRSTKDAKKNEHLFQIHPNSEQFLQLVEADLNNQECWDQAMEGIDYVIHTASPFPSQIPKNENELITPAVNGTSFVFEAALRANVQQIVITSSIAAIFTGVNSKNNFTTEDWSDPNNSPPYEKSKHLAEKKAWEIYEQNKDQIQMTIINPGYIQGPTFSGSNIFTSAVMITKLLKNDMAGIPKVSFGLVDVREVAIAHVRAVEKKYLDITNGKRYLLVENSYWLVDIANTMREQFKPYGYQVPSCTVGTFMFNLAACFDAQARLIKPFLNRMITFDNKNTIKDLEINFRNGKETLIDMAYDLIDKKYIEDQVKGKRIEKKK